MQRKVGTGLFKLLQWKLIFNFWIMKMWHWIIEQCNTRKKKNKPQVFNNLVS